jgi:hypothetical protein
MVTRRAALGLTLFLMMSAVLPASAADVSAKDFVMALYKSYEGKDAKGIPLDSSRAKAVITASLMALIDADSKRAARRKDVPDLDGDPFVDAQDWEISGLTVDAQEQGASAVAKVAFTNAGQKTAITLNLIKTAGTWRIDDFTGPSGSVRKLLSKKK